MSWQPVYIGLGSNLEEPPRQIRRALQALGTVPDTQVLRYSRLFRSRPLGPVVQADFCNAVAALQTRLDAVALHAALRALELSLGRDPAGERWGPRLIDLDLLVYADLRIDLPQLTVPHPGIAVRNFVLLPLLDLAPELVIPGVGPVRELALKVSSEGISAMNEAAG
ncbi:MAG TPA: 2-amino-4-hydroxy-6-hydroxymethyldihydropteridine diphosphokinase [Steroidobacteraceae bacterium]